MNGTGDVQVRSWPGIKKNPFRGFWLLVSTKTPTVPDGWSIHVQAATPPFADRRKVSPWPYATWITGSTRRAFAKDVGVNLTSEFMSFDLKNLVAEGHVRIVRWLQGRRFQF